MLTSQPWHKSSYSGGKTENCVEVSEGARTAVRDTQNRSLGTFDVAAPEWQAFLTEVKAGLL